MKTFSLFLSIIIALLNSASAQEAAASRPLAFTVRPLSKDSPEERALARQERLLKMMTENDFRLRSICVNCGDGWKHNSYAPFDPAHTLNGSPPEMATQIPGRTILVPDSELEGVQ